MNPASLQNSLNVFSGEKQFNLLNVLPPYNSIRIYFIDPEDKEFKETIKNARKKLETSVAPFMPCKITKSYGSGASNKIQTKLACILEAVESTRIRVGNSEPSNHEDHIAGSENS